MNAPSPELLADIEALIEDHGLSRELTGSLLSSKREARAHLVFFRRMMFITNGAMMTAALILAGFGVKELTAGFSLLGAVCAVVGCLLFLKFTAVFASMTCGLNAARACALKHDLI